MSYNKETKKYEGYIYRIQNKNNSHCYIGQTSRTPRVRWDEHIRSSFNGHGIYKIHDALRKYGVDGFEYIIEKIFEADTIVGLIDLLNNAEIEFISRYNALNQGYNMTPGGNVRMSGVGIPVDVYDLYGNLLMVCDTCILACIEFDISPAALSNVINGKSGFALGYVIRKHGEPFDKYEIYRMEAFKKKVYQFNRNGQIVHVFDSHKEVYRKYNIHVAMAIDNPLKTLKGFWWGSTNVFYGKNAFRKTIDQYTKDLEYVSTYNSLLDAAMSVGKTSQSAIQGCCIGRTKSAYGYIWRYSNDIVEKYSVSFDACHKPVDMYDTNCNLINEFATINIASAETGIDTSKIRRCCKKDQKMADGYYFAWHGEIPEFVVGTGNRIIQCNDNHVVENIFNSVDEAHFNLKNSTSCITSSIKSGKSTKGRYFYRINIKIDMLPNIGDIYYGTKNSHANET